MKLYIKNAFANLLGGCSNALLAIVLPPFFIRAMPSETYGIWTLVVQLSGYVALLNFGIAIAVGRYVSHASELKDAEKRNQVASTALAVLALVSLAAIAGLLTLAGSLPRIFHQLPATQVGEARVALLMIGGSNAFTLVASVFSGVFIGLQRNTVPALVTFSSRLLLVPALALALHMNATLVTLAALVAGSNVLGAAAQYAAFRRWAPFVAIARRFVCRSMGRELARYGGIAVWSAGMLMVNGLDTTIVGIFDFKHVAVYATAASLIPLLAGLQSALFSTLVPLGAQLQARETPAHIGRLLIAATRCSTLMLAITGLPLIAFAWPILRLWVGREFADGGAPILRILVLANVIRLSLAPYSMLLLATAQQRLVLISPLAEGVTNVMVSIVAGYYLGGVGVALGTLAGSLVSVGSHLFYNMPRTKSIAFEFPAFLREGFVRPLAYSAPVCAVVWIAARTFR